MNAPATRDSIEPDVPLSPTGRLAPGIPAILFQTWKTREGLPPVMQSWRDGFVEMNPSFVFPLWDDADNREFIRRNFPWFLDVYDAYPREIFRADAVRYFFLYAHGGVYADLDMICLRPLDDLLGREAAVLGRMGPDAGFEHSLPNAAMASPPRHPLWLLAVAEMIAAHEADPDAEVEYLTGPVLLKRTHDAFASGGAEVADRIRRIADLLPAELRPTSSTSVEVLRTRDWFPFNWADPIHQEYRRGLQASGQVPTGERCRELFRTSTMVTFWTNSWGADALLS